MGRMKEVLENELVHINYMEFIINFQEQLEYARDLGTSE
jgi:hypothetical protein